MGFLQRFAFFQRIAARRRVNRTPCRYDAVILTNRRVSRMNDAVSTWRPPPLVRPIAVGIIWRASALLLVAVREHDDALIGWRPPGGTIEFGERAADALKREFLEELGQPIADPEPLSVLENLYTHGGTPGHEIVFVFRTAFLDTAAYARERFEFKEGLLAQEGRWIDRSQIRAGEAQLLPLGLAEKLAIQP
jgi:ADP-ribose pyrophosphatase YjhB (NUDIX family)